MDTFTAMRNGRENDWCRDYWATRFQNAVKMTRRERGTVPWMRVLSRLVLRWNSRNIPADYG